MSVIETKQMHELHFQSANRRTNVLFHHNHRVIQSTNYESVIPPLPLHYCFNTDLFKSLQVCKAEGKLFDLVKRLMLTCGPVQLLTKSSPNCD